MNSILEISIPARVYRNTFEGRLHLFQVIEDQVATVVLKAKFIKLLRRIVIHYKLNAYPLSIQNPTDEMIDLLGDIDFPEIWLEQSGERFMVDSLEQLRTLWQLTISDRDDIDFSVLKAFTKLEDLRLENLSNLVRLSQLPYLPNLKTLTIRSCPNLLSLKGFLFPKLIYLEIDQCNAQVNNGLDMFLEEKE